MAAVPAVVVVGVIAFLVGKNYVPPIRDSAPAADKTGVSPPASETVPSESKNDPTPTPAPPVDPVPERPPGTVFRDPLKDGSEGPAMVVVPGGTFRMGDNRGGRDMRSSEQPVHEVSLEAPFALGQFEVTVGQFRRFVSETGYVTRAEREGGCSLRDAGGKAWKRDPHRRWNEPGFPQGEGHPVVCVVLEDAEAYIDWLSGRTGARYRLPTEAEWEYAARAGTTESRYWGDDPDAACPFANGADRRMAAKYPNWPTANCDDGYLYTAPTGTYRPNRFGLYEMLGNAGEWTTDCWHENYDSAPQDNSAWLEAGSGDCNLLRVVRGGSWFDVPRLLRSADRLKVDTDGANISLGFRLARAL